MISDGAGFNAFDACSYYQHGMLGQQVYDSFLIKMACSTYMLNYDGTPQGYDPVQMWNDFNYVKGDNDYTIFTDSAAAATAMNSGFKTTKGRVNVDMDGAWFTTFAEYAEDHGKSTGAVSSVELSHATPACIWAHNVSRSNYKAIAREMILNSDLDVIMGAGHPLFDDNGEPVAPGILPYKFVGGLPTWNKIVNNTTGRGWTFIENKRGFEFLANGLLVPPAKVLGIPQVHLTLQYKRSGSGMGDFITTVPTLETMTRGALRVLEQNGRGFFLMVEGGAVDWANHQNRLGRMIEEQIDFNRSVEAAVDWISANGGWQDNLLIVTADHECGMIWGPGSYIDINGNGRYNDGVDRFVDWMPIENRGLGVLPGVQYGSGGHTNALVPVYAQGAGAKFLLHMADGVDIGAALFWDFSGLYVDNRDIFSLMMFAQSW